MNLELVRIGDPEAESILLLSMKIVELEFKTKDQYLTVEYRILTTEY